jgi:hypothetical protein
VYLEATIPDSDDINITDWSQKFSLDKQGMHFLRRSLGHPVRLSTSVRVVVASPNGMDSSSSYERFLVAARLWADGISAEYMPQSGVMLSLLKRMKEESSSEPGASVSDGLVPHAILLDAVFLCCCLVSSSCFHSRRSRTGR